eukprot:COSAG05_NODE_194_length_14555_cov_25.382955_10_plen_805_part_00
MRRAASCGGAPPRLLQLLAADLEHLLAGATHAICVMAAVKANPFRPRAAGGARCRADPAPPEPEPEPEPEPAQQAEVYARQFVLLDTERTGVVPTHIAVSFFQSSPTVPRFGHRDLNRLWKAACGPSSAGTVSQQQFVTMASLMLQHSTNGVGSSSPCTMGHLSAHDVAAAVQAAGGGEGGVSVASAVGFFRRSKLPSAKLNKLWRASGATNDPKSQISPEQFRFILAGVCGECEDRHPFWVEGETESSSAPTRTLTQSTAEATWIVRLTAFAIHLRGTLCQGHCHVGASPLGLMRSENASQAVEAEAAAVAGDYGGGGGGKSYAGTAHLCPGPTDSEKKRWRAAFEQADADGDGIVSASEARAFYLGSGLRSSVLRQVWVLASGQSTNAAAGLDLPAFCVSMQAIVLVKSGTEVSSLRVQPTQPSTYGEAVASSRAMHSRRVTVHRASSSSSDGTADGAVIVVPDSWAAFVEKVRQKLQLRGTFRDQGVQFTTADGGAIIDELEALRDGDVLFVAGAFPMHDGTAPVPATVSQFEIASEDLEVYTEQQLGSGSFGTVYAGRWRGTVVAVKKLVSVSSWATGSGGGGQDNAVMQKSEQAGKMEARIADFQAEINILGRLRHPNVVLFLGAVTASPNLCHVTEFVKQGNLFELLHNKDGAPRDDVANLSPAIVLSMARDVSRGMAYLHGFSPPILHRDIKSTNLLVGDGHCIKLCDFGLSRVKVAQKDTEKNLAAGDQVGTPQWMAPEILQNEDYSELSDVYSFGVVLCEILTREVPWYGLDTASIVFAVCVQEARPTLPSEVSA